MCAFDETGALSGPSESATYSYSPTFTTPTDVKVSDSGGRVEWNEVANAVRYNLRFYKNDTNRTLYTWYYTSSRATELKYFLAESGDYLFSVQAMDSDYNVSEWSKLVPLTYTVAQKLGTPQNLRLDESGERILWDAVDGAEYYMVCINSTFYDGKYSRSPGTSSEENQFEWKSLTYPYSDGEYTFQIYAAGSEYEPSDYSEPLVIEFDSPYNESIIVPENIRLENGSLHWDSVDETNEYWVLISTNGELIEFYDAYSNPYINIGNQYPEGVYEMKLFVTDKNHNYNSKTYNITLDTSHDETVWVPEMYFKFSSLLWDWDRLRHEDTGFFWLRIKQDDTVVRLVKTYNEIYYDFPTLEDGNYTVDACVYEYSDKLGNWSEPLNIKKHGEGLFDKENEVTESVEAPPEAADIPEEDRITSITINPAFNMKDKHDNNVELDLSKIKIKAKEIYDEEGLKRASEALGEELKGNKHYNLLDLTLLYNGEDYSNGYEGLVQVIIPIPKGHRDKTFSCYRLTEVDGKMVKELIDGEQTEDSYIIYLEHFSEYALVGAGEDNDEPGTTTPSASFYKIDLKTDGNGKASANVKNPEEVEAGTDVTLTATPNSGYKFSKWTVVKGDVTIKDNKFTMPESDVEIKAEFTKTSSGSGSGSSGGSYGGSRRPSSSSSAAETVTVNGKSGSWSDVISTIDSAANYGVITISGNTNIPADVISAAAKKNIRLEVKVNDTFTWVIDAAKVGETFKYLSITDETITSVNKTIKSGEVSRDFRVTESKLGTGASIRYNAGASNSGKFANLFRVNGTTLEFVGVVKVDTAGNALLPITAAGAYKIVISDETKLVGDINNSMEINALDAAAMLKKLVMNEVTAEEAAKFDFNGDGKANALDAAAILKCIVNS